MGIVFADRRSNIVQSQGAVGLVGNRVRVHPTKSSDPAGFEQERVGFMPQDNFITAVAVRQNSCQIAHGP